MEPLPFHFNCFSTPVSMEIGLVLLESSVLTIELPFSYAYKTKLTVLPLQEERSTVISPPLELPKVLEESLHEPLIDHVLMSPVFSTLVVAARTEKEETTIIRARINAQVLELMRFIFSFIFYTSITNNCIRSCEYLLIYFDSTV